MTQVATAWTAGPISGVRPRSASTDSCPDRSADTTAQHGAGTQVARAIDDDLGDLRRLERGVDAAHDVEQRVAALDAAAQRALKHAQPGRQVQTGRRERDLARATQLGSALTGGTGRLVQRDRHPRGSTG